MCEQLYSTRSDVRISMPDTKWFWELFPTILHWKMTDVRVVAYALPISTDLPEGAKEKQRRKLLEGMGVEVIETVTLPFRGILFGSPGSPGAGATSS